MSNSLSESELERLIMLAEECGEVVQAVGKIVRHGYESCHPDVHGGDWTNRQELAREVLDVIAMVNLMLLMEDIDVDLSMSNVISRINHKMTYTHHQGQVKTMIEEL